MDAIVTALLAHGLPGIIILVLIYAVMQLYRDNKAMQAEYVTKYETLLGKTSDLAANLNKVLDSISRNPPR